MNNFHGHHRKCSYFEGWYLKHQKGDKSIAFIPAFHIDRKGRQTATIQVITESGSYCFSFEKNEFAVSRRHFCVRIGHNLFSEKGVSIELKNSEAEITGSLHYSSFLPLCSDIMGPFHCVPFMQCNHGVVSMIHSVEGKLAINGEIYNLQGGTGYIEKDYGSSFPRRYTWTQCSDWTGKQDCSLMVSAAHIPFGLFHFTGCICAVWYHGKEYRIATYLGAKILRDAEDELVIKQGKYRLSVKRLSDTGTRLYAPRQGTMDRIIKENIACKVHYKFTAADKTIFDFTSRRASFESVRQE